MGNASPSAPRGPRRVVIQGLSGAGKTMVLKQLNLGSVTRTVDGGVDVETVTLSEHVVLTAWSGKRLRHLSRDAQAMIFVIDSSDRDRLDEARTELRRAMADACDVPCLVLANKQDVDGAATVAELCDHLELFRLHQRSHVQACSAKRGEGLFEGLDWLSSVLADGPKKRRSPQPFDDDDDDHESPLECLAAPFFLLWGPRQGRSNLKVLSRAVE
mmetsp:Transcript_7445/g.19373  ORF Transcript_7445/g.19373 Transcript_7445/m.19373 type:complete len:215 (+) Transcript_7445:59-703(+)